MKGFTLIELMVVLAIVGILVAMVAPLWQQESTNSLQSTSEKFTNKPTSNCRN